MTTDLPTGFALWRRFPVVLRAVLIGLVVATAGTAPWAALLSANARHSPGVPWAVPVTALHLWLFWRYVRGAGWPRSTANTRRSSCRANSLPQDVWGMALFAGALGLVAVLLLQRVMSRLAPLPSQQDLDPSQYPLLTVLLFVLMGSLVAGVVEEAAFRGYLQGPIERRHGPVLAILVTGFCFGLAHTTHAEVTLVLLPYYLAVSTVYGALAYLTDSILPSLVLHAGGNLLSAFGLLVRGRSEWQPAPSPKPLLWDSGPDGSFWLALGGTLLVGTAAAWAYTALARVVRQGRARESHNPLVQLPGP